LDGRTRLLLADPTQMGGSVPFVLGHAGFPRALADWRPGAGMVCRDEPPV
jgi:hypothetical protein